MIEITNSEVWGFNRAIKAMRNPLNSWERSDSFVDLFNEFELGDADSILSRDRLGTSTEERKHLRMIHVQADVLAPLYWWKEYDTYKVGTTAISCSTMHKITSKPIDISDFSIEDFEGEFIGGNLNLSDCFINVVADCEMYRKKYLETKDKRYWKALIQLLPSSYNQLRTIDLNYEVLLRIYEQRRNHKLTEWHDFCNWIRDLPHISELTKISVGV